ncbi:ras GTPase-activating protein-binding protein 1-like [Sorex fumeus]|uniref:ras GTPase-activating protein-binding protein 1-like n=1 Tax=Sorex fumeus TaxID=62283 RepID=UPI0024AE2FD9|nr:ras GTPase-activating protein-binding protein 1-like [Sorex fumeus]
MVSEKLSALQFGQEFVSQYYTILKRAPETLQKFYGENSSYVHGGLDSHGKPAAAVYGQAEIHRKVMSQSFMDCHVEILHVDAQATLSEGVLVQVLGLLSNNNQELRRFMQTFVLAPQGSAEGKFYLHNDIFRYLDEVFDGLDTQEQSKKEVEEEPREEKPEAIVEEAVPEATQRSPSQAPTDLAPADLVPADPTPTDLAPTDLAPAAPAPADLAPAEPDPVDPAPADPNPAQEDVRPVSWASVICKKLGPVTGTPPHVVKEPAAQPRPKTKPESPIPPQRRQQDRREKQVQPSPRGANWQGPKEPGRAKRHPDRHPDSHQLFLGNLPHDVDKPELQALFQTFGSVVELRIHSRGELPNFGFVAFDSPAPVQKVLSKRPIMLRGAVRLNVQEKKPRAAREGDWRPRGPGVPPEGLGFGQRGSPQRALLQQRELEVEGDLAPGQ